MLDVLMGLMVEWIFDLGVEAAGDHALPRPVRLVLGLLIAFCFVGALGLVVWVGFLALEDSILGAILLWILAAGTATAGIRRVRKALGRR